MKSPFRRQDPEPEAPRGVRLTRPDGTTVRCGVARDPSGDKDGNVHWIAHPIEPYVLRAGDRLSVDYLPGRTSLALRLPREKSGE